MSDNELKSFSKAQLVAKAKELGFKGYSSYDNGIYIYSFPLQGGKDRFHPTQKSLALFEELIKKHSNENDVVLDTFLGS